MAERAHGHGYRLYWSTWLSLLIITVLMIAFEVFHVPRLLMVLTLVTFMLIKASFIAGNFMHLRFERFTLVLIVVVGLLLTGAVLFALISPDGVRLLHLSSP